MKGMTFENFRVDSGNRAAYDYCRRAAVLQYEAGRPVLLLGPEGAGKTHLLWSVVQYVRASSARAGLALVMASEFPEQVRQLALNPAPIQDNKPALLLVDELESFAQDAYALEGVVTAFLANGHGVLLASAVHPDRLATFSEPFRALLCEGDILDMRPVGPTLATLTTEDDAFVDVLRAERDALEQKLAQKANESNEMANVRARLDEAMRQVEQLTLALADTSRFELVHERHRLELGAVEAERDSYRQAVDALRDERDTLERRLVDRVSEVEALRERLVTSETENAGARALSAEEEGELLRLRHEVAALERTHAEETALQAETIVALRTELAQAVESATRANEVQAGLRDRVNHLQAEMGEYRGGLEEARDLRRQLEEAQAAANLERAELAIALRATQEFEAALEAERAKAEEEMNALRGAVHGLVAEARARGPVDTHEIDTLRAALQEADARSAAFRQQMDCDRRAQEEEAAQLRAECAELQALAEKSSAESGRNLVATESLKGRVRALEYELDKARKRDQFLTAEMEALRNEAATQVAQANLQAGEREGEAARLRAALENALSRGQSALAHTDAAWTAFTAATDALRIARAELGGIEDANAAPQDAPSNGVPEDQGHLFDTAPFIREFASLPDAFDTPPPSLPHTGDAARSLHELVEEALAGESPQQA